MKNYKIKVDNQSFSVNVEQSDPETLSISVNGKTFSVSIEEIINVKKKEFAETKNVYVPVQTDDNVQNDDDNNIMKSPVNGIIVDVKIKPGEQVKQGTLICIIEAMKMESEVYSSVEGKVSKIFISKNDSIKANQPIMEVV